MCSEKQSFSGMLAENLRYTMMKAGGNKVFYFIASAEISDVRWRREHYTRMHRYCSEFDFILNEDIPLYYNGGAWWPLVLRRRQGRVQK